MQYVRLSRASRPAGGPRRPPAQSDNSLYVGYALSFEAGLAYGLQTPFLLVLLPETRILPATCMGHFYVELSGGASDQECLRAALVSVTASLADKNGAGHRTRRAVQPVGLSRMGCAVGRNGR